MVSNGAKMGSARSDKLGTRNIYQRSFQFAFAAFHAFADKLGHAAGTPSRPFQKVVDDCSADRYLNFHLLAPEYVEFVVQYAARIKTSSMRCALDHLLSKYGVLTELQQLGTATADAPTVTNFRAPR